MIPIPVPSIRQYFQINGAFCRSRAEQFNGLDQAQFGYIAEAGELAILLMQVKFPLTFWLLLSLAHKYTSACNNDCTWEGDGGSHPAVIHHRFGKLTRQMHHNIVGE